MRRRDLFILFCGAAALFAGNLFLAAQGPQIKDTITRRVGQTRIAVPDFRGKGEAQPLMDAFNSTVWNDLEDAGILELVAKTNYPLEVPQALSDFRPPSMVNGKAVRNGPWLTDWSNDPVNTDYLGIGSADVMGGTLVVRGSLLIATKADAQAGKIFDGKVYVGALNEAGARKVGHQYAADILQQLGAVSLAGTKIYFVSTRTGPKTGNPQKEIFVMDYDGQGQTRLTSNRSLCLEPAISSDGRKLAYTALEHNAWSIKMLDAQTHRSLTFVNTSDGVGTPEFSPDGTKLWFNTRDNDGYRQIANANINGSGLQRITHGKTIDVSPHVNPKNGDVLYISGRNGVQAQLYRMKSDGSGAERLTNGEGEVSNPSWSPDGTKIAFAWTRGYERGKFNIFVMDAKNTDNIVQLTRGGSDANENPSWAPDGVHLVFSMRKAGSTNAQIYTMRADGKGVKQLTSDGDNTQPVWARATE